MQRQLLLVDGATGLKFKPDSRKKIRVTRDRSFGPKDEAGFSLNLARSEGRHGDIIPVLGMQPHQRRSKWGHSYSAVHDMGLIQRKSLRRPPAAGGMTAWPPLHTRPSPALVREGRDSYGARPGVEA